jgi:hypothetical protein
LQEVERKVGAWNQETKKKMDRWGDPNYVEARIIKLEAILRETAEGRSGKQRHKDGGRNTHTRQHRRQQAIARLQKLAIQAIATEDEQKAWGTFMDARNNEDARRAGEEKKETEKRAKGASEALQSKKESEVWRIKRDTGRISKPALPLCLFDKQGQLLSGKEELLEEVRRAVNNMCNPTKQHWLAPRDPDFEREIEAKHRRYRVLARNGQNSWDITREDCEATSKYYKKSASRDGAPGMTDTTAKMYSQGGEQVDISTELVLKMVAKCKRRPNYWAHMAIVLGRKPGRPKQNIETSYRPITLQETNSKGFEAALMLHYDDAIRRNPLHPIVII